MIDDVDFERDGALVARFQAGDEGGFTDIYRRYFKRIERLCLRLLGNPQDAEDVAQGTFAKAYKALAAFQGDRVFPWLYVVAKNACNDLLRLLGRSGALMAEVTDETDPAASVVSTETTSAVRLAMGLLSPRHRGVLSQRYIEGLDYATIARRSSITVGAVETVLWRARQAFKIEYARVGA